ncbi:MAG TPA: inositol monophosphatase family protein [Bryobacteraceae bacterium]|nr:inositol monophosphatase family protein [Bryobacteraceae bacterium]
MSYLETAVEIAREAGALLAHYFERRVAVETKGEFDLVTEADRASEKLVVERLRTHFPSHSIVAEEGGGHTNASSEYCWFVDPLDGTTNFAHGFPVFNVTMGLARAGEMIAGVVYDPLRQEMFAAERGAGAYLNNRRIHVSSTKRIGESLSSTGFPSRKRHHNINIHFYYQVAMASHGVRRTGSAAVDLAAVAAGRLDYFWEFGLKPWDMAAGILLVSEAGGKVTDMKGDPLSVTSSDHLLADNGALHEEVLEAFRTIFGGTLRVPLPSISL